MASEAEYSAKHSWLSKRSKSALLAPALMACEGVFRGMVELLHTIKLCAI
jgi:hypothetical protein